jgi:hypothetical protein
LTSPSESPNYFAPSAARSTVAPRPRWGFHPGGGDTHRRAQHRHDRCRAGRSGDQPGSCGDRFGRIHDDCEHQLSARCRFYDAGDRGRGGDALSTRTDAADDHDDSPPDYHHCSDYDDAPPDYHHSTYDHDGAEHDHHCSDDHNDHDYDYDYDDYDDPPGDHHNDRANTGHPAEPECLLPNQLEWERQRVRRCGDLWIQARRRALRPDHRRCDDL